MRAHPVQRSHPAGPRAERGLSSSVQWALLAPLVLLTVLGLIQAGVVLHARTTVRQAAMAAAESEAVLGSQPGRSRAIVDRMVAPVGMEQVTTSITRSRGSVTVVVAGRAPLFFDIGMAGVSATAVMPMEVP